MYGIKELKEHIRITENSVECPVNGCSKKVERQRNTFRRNENFLCEEHGIYISPSTFEYKNPSMNILWEDDLKLLEQILGHKRESRIARDNSEDALTFNVFRYFEQEPDLFQKWLLNVTGSIIEKPEIVYWSHQVDTGKVYPLLVQARREFGEMSNRGSEPDLIVCSEGHLIFIEAKFTSGNNTKPSKPENVKKYLTGGKDWYDNVFIAKYKHIANEKRKYELLRFWLLGTWMADQEGKQFHLVNLVLLLEK